ncbi:MAG: hypothetical protein ACK5YO_37150, partial [Planctomyces sp.]
GYLDFWVDGSQGGTVNAQSLLDSAAEFTVTGNAAADVIFNGQAEQLSENSYRYFFTGSFTTGDVSFYFGNGTFSDSNGIPSVAETEALSITGVRATRVYPNAVVFGNSALTQQGYFDIAFTPTSGSTLNVSSILDPGAELRVLGAAAKTVRISGAPQQIDEYTFRYSFEGAFDAGKVQLTVIDGSATDSAGHAVNGWTEELLLRELVPSLVSPLHQSNA